MSHIDTIDDPPDPSSMTLSEIYEQVLGLGEIILTIPADEEEKLRKGLASVKAKANKKLADEGLPQDKSTLSYTSTENKDFVGAVDVHITLAVKHGITVLNLRQPDEDPFS